MRTRFLSQRSHDCRSLTEETLKRCDEWLPWKPYRRVGAISFESVFTEERDETKQSGKARRSTFQRFVDERNRACQHPVTVVPCNLTPTSWTSSSLHTLACGRTQHPAQSSEVGPHPNAASRL